MSNIVTLPTRFDWRRKFSAGELVKNDENDRITAPFSVWIFTTRVETEAGIQYVAETISPKNLYAVGGTEASAIYHLITCLIRKTP